jgi:hypothetical protein
MYTYAYRSIALYIVQQDGKYVGSVPPRQSKYALMEPEM